jgi:hypothetical protein
MVLAVPAKRAVHTIGNGNRSRHGTSDFDGKLGDGHRDGCAADGCNFECASKTGVGGDNIGSDWQWLLHISRPYDANLNFQFFCAAKVCYCKREIKKIRCRSICISLARDHLIAHREISHD